MSRVKPRGTVAFPASPSTDVVGYRFYYRQVGTPDPGDPGATPPIPPGEADDGNLSYNDASAEIPLSSVSEDGNVVVDLGALELPSIDGELRVGLSAIDDAGNESDIGPTVDVPFDSVAPDAPGLGVFTPG